jgi:hypothetical protein
VRASDKCKVLGGDLESVRPSIRWLPLVSKGKEPLNFPFPYPSLRFLRTTYSRRHDPRLVGLGWVGVGVGVRKRERGRRKGSGERRRLEGLGTTKCGKGWENLLSASQLAIWPVRLG